MIPGEYPARRAACLDSAKLFGVKSLRFASIIFHVDDDNNDNDDGGGQGGEQRDA